MPDGVVAWFDASAGEAGIRCRRRQFVARAADVVPEARHVGARVHFDIRRDDGAQTAIEVRLRGGMRSARRHHRFATLVGARRPDTKGPSPFAHAHPEYGLALAGHPLQVAGAWARFVAAGDADQALAFYLPNALLHIDSDGLRGRRHLRAGLEAQPVFASGRQPTVRGEDGLVLVRWDAKGKGEPAVDAQCRIEHGLIAEQWIGTPGRRVTAPTLEAASGPIPLSVVTRGEVSDEAVDYARHRVEHLAKLIDEPILFARMKLEVAPDPARTRPATAQALLDVNGHAVRAHVAAHDLHEAADLLQGRLQDKLEHKAERLEALRRHAPGRAEVGEWRHGDLPTARPEFFDRPVEERQLVRHKPFVAAEQHRDEAAFDMDQADYGFYLFRDLDTGEDSLLERLSAGGCRIQRLHPVPVAPTPSSAYEFTDDDTAAPELSVDGAIERLNASGEPFVFFASAVTGRGAVVYRRYDGHYGLITLEELQPAATG
jgi:ribosome-associated translation inhibitor RaiA